MTRYAKHNNAFPVATNNTRRYTKYSAIVAKGFEPNNYIYDSVDESITRITASTP